MVHEVATYSDFANEFDTNEKCLAFLAEQKWGNSDFICRNCGHNNFCKAKRPFSRRCTRCKHDESATVGTLFEGCRFPLPKAFIIAHTVCSSPEASTIQLAQELDLRHLTCWNFKQKLIDTIKRHTNSQTPSSIHWHKIVISSN